MEETTKSQINTLPNQELDYFKIAKIILSRWYWIAGALIICIIIANLYLWYTPKTYSTGSTLKFEEKKTELSDLNGGGAGAIADRPSSKIQSETIVLQSTALILNAIKDLDYHISFFIKGRILNRTTEMYPQKPLDIQFINFDSLNFYHDVISFQSLNNHTFTLKYMVSGKPVQQIYRYNVPFTIGLTSLSIKYPEGMPKNTFLSFKLNAPEDFIGRVKGGLHIGETAKNSNILGLQESDLNPQFAADILNAIMKEYLTYDSNQRRLSDSQMIDFIDNQLDFLSNQVKGSSNLIADYKNKSKILDVATASQEALSESKALGSQLSLLKIQLIALDQVKQQIIKNKGNITLDLDVQGEVDSQLTNYLPSLNALMLQRNSLAKTFTANSEYLLDINNQILQVKNHMLNGLNASYKLIQSKINYLNEQLAPVDRQIAILPAAEREMVSLQRDFEINDKVYSFLSEKKLDAQISSAGVLPGATIVDTAQPNFNPVSPNEQEIRETAVFLVLPLALA